MASAYLGAMSSLTRRSCLQAMAPMLAAPAAAAARVASKAPESKLAIPGPYRGRVVAVQHPGAIVANVHQTGPVQQMLRRGMQELTGADSWVEAWRRLFHPGDVVGIKVNPVGRPHVISSPEALREIIAGLEAAGIKRQDIV